MFKEQQPAEWHIPVNPTLEGNQPDLYKKTL